MALGLKKVPPAFASKSGGGQNPNSASFGRLAAIPHTLDPEAGSVSKREKIQVPKCLRLIDKTRRSRGASGLDSERHRRLFVESKELRLVDKPSSLRKRPLLAQARKRGIDAESTVLRNIKSMSSIFGGARYQEAPRRLSLEVRAKYGV